MAANQQDYSLHSALPAEVLVRGNTVWARYRQYPVFSLPWLRGRSLLFALVIALFAVVVALGTAVDSNDVSLGIRAGALILATFLLMATAGPALATWVRHRRWSLRRERTAVVLAVLVGMGSSALADYWASNYILRELHVSQDARGVTRTVEPELGDTGKPLPLAFNILLAAGLYGLFGGGMALRAYFGEGRRVRDNQHHQELAQLRAAKQESDHRLGLLQAQVEPHFLFNTLASVRALVRQDPAQAEATLDALVDHLRATIPRLRDGESLLHSTLGQQLDICASYLELMRLRMGGRLNHAVEASDDLRARPFPPLLLITLVENAIKHGIEPQPGPGRIEVRASTRGDRLVLSVVDDGIGLQPGLGTGVGLANVREQLANRHGDQASLALRSLAGRGTVAEIVVPLEPPR